MLTRLPRRVLAELSGFQGPCRPPSPASAQLDRKHTTKSEIPCATIPSDMGTYGQAEFLIFVNTFSGIRFLAGLTVVT